MTWVTAFWVAYLVVAILFLVAGYWRPEHRPTVGGFVVLMVLIGVLATASIGGPISDSPRTVVVERGR